MLPHDFKSIFKSPFYVLFLEKKQTKKHRNCRCASNSNLTENYSSFSLPHPSAINIPLPCSALFSFSSVCNSGSVNCSLISLCNFLFHFFSLLVALHRRLSFKRLQYNSEQDCSKLRSPELGGASVTRTLDTDSSSTTVRSQSAAGVNGLQDGFACSDVDYGLEHRLSGNKREFASKTK